MIILLPMDPFGVHSVKICASSELPLSEREHVKNLYEVAVKEVFQSKTCSRLLDLIDPEDEEIAKAIYDLADKIDDSSELYEKTFKFSINALRRNAHDQKLTEEEVSVIFNKSFKWRQAEVIKEYQKERIKLDKAIRAYSTELAGREIALREAQFEKWVLKFFLFVMMAVAGDFYVKTWSECK